MKIKEIAWVAIRLYGIYDILLAVLDFTDATLIHQRLLHSQLHDPAACAWYGLVHCIIGLFLMFKTKMIVDLIYSGLKFDEKDTLSSQGSSQNLAP
jgi:hypothetical protein